MAQIQADIRRIVEDLWDRLADLENGKPCDLESLFRQFYSKAWKELPLGLPKGAALATASCIPVWEMLNCVTHPCCSLSKLDKARVVQLLTAMYPKFKDRRVLYQQLNRNASGTNNSVPLSTGTPESTETIGQFIANGSCPKELKGLSLGQVDLEKRDTYSRKIASVVKTVVDKILPNIEIRMDAAGVKFMAICGAGEPFPLEWLSALLWECLLFSELTGVSEKRSLIQFLTSSKWSTKTVSGCSRRIEYSFIFTPLVAMCSVCASENPRTPPTAADNTPLFDPRLVDIITRRDEVSADTCALLEVAEKAEAQRNTLTRPKENIAEKTRASTIEKLTNDIPGEIEFMGSSPSCRDCDQVTMLCRDLLFSTFPTSSENSPTKPSLKMSALFSRKRSRDGSSTIAEGPSFLPVASSISDLLSDGGATELNTLERLSLSWRS